VASDLDAFVRVLDGGRAGRAFRTGDAADLATVLAELLDDPGRRAALARHGAEVVRRYDWPVVAQQVVQVYETVAAARPGRVTEDSTAPPATPAATP
jgi:phosphatidylinositol alpha-mannosyltransferase